jgi:hypothetical protein
MAGVELTEEMIAAAMAKAEGRVCVGSNRCFALPHRLEDAHASCTLKGRCTVGWIIAKSGRESWDVWRAVSTGLVLGRSSLRVDVRLGSFAGEQTVTILGRIRPFLLRTAFPRKAVPPQRRRARCR